MKALVEHLTKSLVDKPEAVEVIEAADGETTKFTLRVAEEDKGKIIGKQGKVIKALRAVIAMAAAKADKHVSVDLE
ncbi:MAG: KH domain-containing protein [Elusimicrobia bacterium]|nr:KH domain-containing protein [Elusimicrobiota bacterium]